jgi:hypothetical protein
MVWGAPVQRFDQCRHAARVLDLVQEIQNCEPVDSVFRVVDVRAREWIDDDIGDRLHIRAVSIPTVRGERLGVDLLEIEDRVLTPNRIGKLTRLSFRIIFCGMTTQPERCNENCNRPPPVAHNHSEPPHTARFPICYEGLRNQRIIASPDRRCQTFFNRPGRAEGPIEGRPGLGRR